VTTVPTRAHLVSGGNVLVRVELPPDADAALARVTLNGADVTSAFREAPVDRLGRPRRALLGLLEGLAEGESTVSVSVGDARSDLTVTNYPISGPIFSGEHLDPYFCLGALAPDRDGEARRFAIGNGAVLRETHGEDCSLETRVDFVYRTIGPEPAFAALPDDGSRPADLAETTTTEGQTVPYIVRLETGTINRAICQTAALVDPSAPAPTPWTPPGVGQLPNTRIWLSYGPSPVNRYE
jgi:hypothetical protein